MTSASIVGIPRLSRISRATIRSIVAVMVWLRLSFLPLTFRCYRVFGRSNAVQPSHVLRHPGPDELHQAGAVVVRVALGRNGVEEMYMHFPRADVERPFRHDLARAVQDGRNDRRLRRDRQHERPLLEGTQVIILPASALGMDDHRAAAFDLLR